MLPKQILEPQWNSTAREGPRARGRLSATAEARRRWSRLILALAVFAPVGLLAALALLLSRPYWLGGSAAEAASKLSTTQALASLPLPPRSRAAGLGQVAAADREMCYKADGVAFLGQYSIQIYDAANQLTLRADFALDGETTCEDAQAFQQWAATHHCLFREQVMVALRNSPLADLLEPKLTRLSRKLVAQVNRSFDEPILNSAHLKGFCLYQAIGNGEFSLWEDRIQGGDPEGDENTSDEQPAGAL